MFSIIGNWAHNKFIYLFLWLAAGKSDVFWNAINLAYISQLEEKDLVYNYPFTSQRESHSVPDIDFFAIP